MRVACALVLVFLALEPSLGGVVPVVRGTQPEGGGVVQALRDLGEVLDDTAEDVQQEDPACVHGKVSKDGTSKPVCVCEDSWSGLDCSQMTADAQTKAEKAPPVPESLLLLPCWSPGQEHELCPKGSVVVISRPGMASKDNNKTRDKAVSSTVVRAFPNSTNGHKAKVVEIRRVPLPTSMETGMVDKPTSSKTTTTTTKTSGLATLDPPPPTFVVTVQTGPAIGSELELPGNQLYTLPADKNATKLAWHEKMSPFQIAFLVLQAIVLMIAFGLFIRSMVSLFTKQLDLSSCEAGTNATVPAVYVMDEHYWTFGTKMSVHAVVNASDDQSEVEEEVVGSFRGEMGDARSSIVYKDAAGRFGGYMKNELWSWNSRSEIGVCGQNNTKYEFEDEQVVQNWLSGSFYKTYVLYKDGVRVAESVKNDFWATEVHFKQDGFAVAEIKRDLFNWGTDHWSARVHRPDIVDPIVIGFVAAAISKARNDRQREENMDIILR